VIEEDCLIDLPIPRSQNKTIPFIIESQNKTTCKLELSIAKQNYKQS